jgi:serine/threonine protein kinase
MLDLYPGMRLGGHELVRRLRDGESRQVFSAKDLSNQRPAVLKVAALGCAADVGRLEREFAVLREAAGPGVVAALGHAIAVPQGLAWVVLAAQGPSLASVLAAQPDQRLATEVALAAVHAAAVALGELHARGWRHGDLKPGNLLCNADGSVTLSDLEFASRLGDGRLDALADLPRAGTPPFVAPELWREGTEPASTAADVWALGVTLYLCLFGDYPFGHEGDGAIAEAIDRGLPRQVDQLPPPLSKLLKVLLARDPADRPLDGREATSLILATVQPLGVDLTGARQTLGRLAAALPEGASLGDPGTVIAPPTPEAPAPSPSPPSSEFFDIASKLDISSRAVLLDPSTRVSLPSPPIKPPSTLSYAPLPSAAEAAPSRAPAAAAPAPLTRRAAARWYRRMNPARNFPLSVVFSGKEIRIVGGSGLGITLGQQEIVLDPSDPVLSVEPWFPGCLISPPRADVHVSQENTVCRFWVTPLVCGDLTEACVTIRYRGKVVETLATPTKVVTRTLAKVLAVVGLGAPVVSKVLTLGGWDSDNVLRRSLPYAADLVAGMGPMRLGLSVAAALLAAALGYYYVTRPLLSEEPEPRLLAQPA